VSRINADVVELKQFLRMIRRIIRKRVKQFLRMIRRSCLTS